MFSVKYHISFLHLVGVVAMATLVLSSWFAHKSLMFKLEARKERTDPPSSRDAHRPILIGDTNQVSVC